MPADATERQIIWTFDSYTPFCDTCNWTGKARLSHAEARGAVASHNRSAGHIKKVKARTVYVLVPVAVYDHGIIGVYSTEEQARAAAEKVWPDTDGHHALVIRPVVLNETYAKVFSHRAYESRPHRDPGEPRIELEHQEEEE